MPSNVGYIGETGEFWVLWFQTGLHFVWNETFRRLAPLSSSVDWSARLHWSALRPIVVITPSRFNFIPFNCAEDMMKDGSHCFSSLCFQRSEFILPSCGPWVLSFSNGAGKTYIPKCLVQNFLNHYNVRYNFWGNANNGMHFVFIVADHFSEHVKSRASYGIKYSNVYLEYIFI